MPPEKTFTVTDLGLTGANIARPGLREALAACRDGDSLVVTKLDLLAGVTEFEADLIRERSREGIAVAKSKGKLRGKQPKLSRNGKRT